MSLTKEEFIGSVWSLINSAKCEALDAVQEIAERNGVDMETAGKLVSSNSALKKLIESQAHATKQLKRPSSALE